MKKIAILFILTFVVSSNAIAGDTVGKVSKIATGLHQNGSDSIIIYLDSVENDRWNCIANQGYIVATDASPLVSPSGLNRILSIAMTAKALGQRIEISSPSTDPCSNANQIVLLD